MSCPRPNAESFADYLQRVLAPAPVELTYTDNSRTMLTVQRREGVWRVRCHHMFKNAPTAVYEAILWGYMRTRGRRRAARDKARLQVRQYIDTQSHQIRRRKLAVRRLPGPQGRHWDLAAEADAVNAEWFDGKLDVLLSWTVRATRRTMGRWYPPESCEHVALSPVTDTPAPSAQKGQLTFPFVEGEPRRPKKPPTAGCSLVTINALLDDPGVPRSYLRFLLYHELLHEHVYRRTGDAKHGHRGLFNRLETRHPQLRTARQWEAQHVEVLWRRWRTREARRRREALR
jgi:hypothetical protein